MKHEDTQQTLIELVKDQHDDSAWEIFVETYEDYIIAVLLKLGIHRDDAVELRQDVLLKLWDNLPNFDYQPEKGKFRTWLYQVIRNTAYTHLDSRASEKMRVERYFIRDSQDSKGTQELDTLMETEWRAYVTSQAMVAMRELFSEQSIKIFTEFLKGVDIKHLAERYELKENTVYRVKNRVKQRLILEVNKIRTNLE